MKKTIRKITSIFLSMAIMLLTFAPTVVSAREVGQMEAAAEKYLIASDDAFFSVRGDEMPLQMRDALTEKSMEINNDTLVELVTIGDNDATVLVATNTEGGLVTRSVLMGVNENGEPLLYTANQLEFVYMSGGNGVVELFDGVIQVTFLISFYAHAYAGLAMGAAQPQVAMFIYESANELYDVSYLSMTYICTGAKGYFDANGGFVSVIGPQDYFSHRITVTESDPRENTHYSKSDPFDENYYILIYGASGGQTGAHLVEYTIQGTKPNNDSFYNSNCFEVTTLYNPNY